MTDLTAPANDGAGHPRTEGNGAELDDGFDGFVAMLRDRLSLPLADVTPGLRLAEDLGFDSVAVFELFVLLEDAAGRELPSELFDNVETLADAWSWFSAVSQQRD